MEFLKRTPQTRKSCLLIKFCIATRFAGCHALTYAFQILIFEILQPMYQSGVPRSAALLKSFSIWFRKKTLRTFSDALEMLGSEEISSIPRSATRISNETAESSRQSCWNFVYFLRNRLRRIERTAVAEAFTLIASPVKHVRPYPDRR